MWNHVKYNSIGPVPWFCCAFKKGLLSLLQWATGKKRHHNQTKPYARAHFKIQTKSKWLLYTFQKWNSLSTRKLAMTNDFHFYLATNLVRLQHFTALKLQIRFLSAISVFLGSYQSIEDNVCNCPAWSVLNIKRFSRITFNIKVFKIFI